MKGLLLGSVCTAVLAAMATTALGQTTSGDTTTQGAPAAQNDSTAKSDKSDETTVIVTAQRRRENLLQTPTAASVISGSTLARKGVVTIDSLQFVMPSVTVDNFGQGLEFNVRGIGKGEHNTQTTTGVITYRDGVPTFPGYFQEEPYFDVADVQVLRGPQGTVVGQNSTGGAVFVNTSNPVIGGGVHGYLNANLGNYSDAGAQGAINIPISDTFAARVAFFDEKRDSFYTITGPGGSAYTGNPGNVREQAGRISFLWKPTHSLSLQWKTDIDHLDMGGYPADPYTDRFSTLPGTSTPNPGYTSLFHITADAPQAALDTFVRSILKVDYNADNGVKWRSISGYSTGRTTYQADLDGTATGTETFYDTVKESQFSQEFNIISPDNQRLTWLLGAFGVWNNYVFPSPYSNFDINLYSPAFLPAYNYELQGHNPERSLAAFGQIGFNITPDLKLDIGGRYTDSSTTNHVDIMQYGTYLRDDQTLNSHNFSYKVSLGWKLDPNNYLYAFTATGFKPGGLNTPVGLGIPAPFVGESVTSYEAGWKSNFGGGRGHMTIDGFYNDYKNFQVIIGYPTYPTFGIELNVPDTTKISGFEAEGDYKIGELTIDAGVNVLHSELGQFYASDSRVGTTTACDPNTGPVSATCANLKGVEQTYAPNFTFNIGAKYDVIFANGNRLTPSFNFGHVAPQWATLFENASLGDRLGARNILSAQVEFTTNKGWSLTLYGTNLTNQHYVAALNSGLDFAGPPLQYGLKLLKVF